MAERRLGAPRLGGKPAPDFTKLSGRLTPYVPRGAQYDYRPPSVFARYKVLTAVFAILLVALFGYWAIVMRHGHAAGAAAAAAPQRNQTVQPGQPPAGRSQPPPQSDPVYIEPLPSR